MSGLVGRPVLAGKGQLHAQGQQPQLQAGGKGQRAQVVIKDAVVIDR